MIITAEEAVLTVGGVRVEGSDIVLTEAVEGRLHIEMTDNRRAFMSVEEARKLARELYRLARRAEKRL